MKLILQAIKSLFTKIERTLEQLPALKASVDQCNADAAEAQATANTAQATANTAQATANTAQATANTARTTANTAQATAEKKANIDAPVFENSLSLGRKTGSTIGSNSVATGFLCEASGKYSHAEGYETVASGDYSHAEGMETVAPGHSSHAEGMGTVASGDYSHAEGMGTVVSGDFSHVQGRFNIEDTEGNYAHVVGNGYGNTNRSNAHTLDWNGNTWYAGSMEGTAVILPSPSGKRFKITVDDNGVLTATEVT